jgi:hypothetical protein
VYVARIMSTWDGFGSASAYMQASFIGRHLATCECSTEEARELIRNIADAMVPAIAPGGQTGVGDSAADSGNPTEQA